jgi:hypothetical protein
MAYDGAEKAGTEVRSVERTGASQVSAPSTADLPSDIQPDDVRLAASLCHEVLAPLADADWTRWVTGRLDVPEREPVPANWAWHASPVAEWDGEIKTRESYHSLDQ